VWREPPGEGEAEIMALLRDRSVTLSVAIQIISCNDVSIVLERIVI
jgi:hypothetical protein